MNKNDLRKVYKELRKNVADRETKEKRIAKKLASYVNGAKSVFCYESIGGEVSTKEIISEISEHSQVFVPEIVGNGIMNVISLDRTHYAQSDCDVTIVPLIAFDETMNRIGFGGGYYDRYLAEHDTLAIGIAFDEQQCAVFSKEPFDMPLDIIITPTRIFEKH